jgi:adenosylcobinamide-GDP ribazoletransferase
MLDALGGGEPAERLRIMADPSIGTYGVLGLVLGVATKISSLMLLGDPARFSALLLAPMLGRTAMVLGAWRAPAARPGGLGAAFGAALGPQDVLVASGFAFVAAVGVAGWLGAAAIVVAGVIVAALRAGTTRCFGGITGDVLGAISEVVETLLLAFFAATRPGS